MHPPSPTSTPFPTPGGRDSLSGRSRRPQKGWLTILGPTDSNDRELLKAARRGDPEAAERLIDRLACIPAMVRLCQRRTGATLTPEERQEVMQETVAALWSKLARFRGETTLEAWVWGFVTRELYRALERRRRMPARELPDALEDRAARGPDNEGRTAIHETVAELGHPDSTIVRLRHFDMMTFDEIADALELRTNTVKSRYYRALERLRTLLRPVWREVER